MKQNEKQNVKQIQNEMVHNVFKNALNSWASCIKSDEARKEEAKEVAKYLPITRTDLE